MEAARTANKELVEVGLRRCRHFQSPPSRIAWKMNLLADGPAHNDRWRLDSVALPSVLRFRRFVLTLSGAAIEMSFLVLDAT
jgi:hypothetical protein